MLLVVLKVVTTSVKVVVVEEVVIHMWKLIPSRVMLHLEGLITGRGVHMMEHQGEGSDA